VSVQRSQASIQRGGAAAFVVQVSTKNNGSLSGVSVAVTAQPSGEKPAFTGGCDKGSLTASCTVSSVSDKQPRTLHAQIPVAASATSVTSVKLTATASIVTSAKWRLPSATETVAVTAASASGSSAASRAAGSPTTPPLGPLPNLNGVSSSLIGPGNASELFPAIDPAAAPSPTPGVNAAGGKRNAQPAWDASPLAFGRPGLTGQVAGLIALAVAVLLTVTRLSLRKRFRSRKQGG
jgi:hypothetical protein